jgi:hypothetical protein
MAETRPEGFIILVVDEWLLLTGEQPFHRPGDLCACGHPARDHHENQVTGDSTWCNACTCPGGCDRFRPAAPQTVNERN